MPWDLRTYLVVVGLILIVLGVCCFVQRAWVGAAPLAGGSAMVLLGVRS